MAVRTLGARYGYALGAIASGFSSNTVTVAAMGHRAAKEPSNLRTLAAAIFSNLATVAQSGFADVHALTASIAALATSDQLALQAASIPVSLAVSCNSLSKCLVAWVSGGRRFAV